MPRPRRETVVNLRMPKAMRDTIDHAAAATGKTRTDFILESSHNRAVDVLLDRRFLVLEDAAFAAFEAALEAPPPRLDTLKALLAEKAPWER